MKLRIQRIRFWRIAHAALCIGLFAATLAAQYRGGIRGVVTDAQDAVVPGATVTLTSKETNIKRTTRTNNTGGYAIPGLPPGNYSLSVE